MPRHASNSERIARAAAEADAKKKEKAAARKAKPRTTATRKARPSKAVSRMKVVWSVGVPGLAPVKTFPYAERAAADAEAEKRGKGCMVMPLKIPMEE